MQGHVSPEGQEIERKYLLRSCPLIPHDARRAKIIQGYLPTGERLRAVDGVFIETVKQGSGVLRSEVERELTAEEFDARWENVAFALEKVRAWIPIEDGRIAEFDTFGGALAGKAVVEVEFPSLEAANAFIPPAWFGREVTDDPRYSNRALAENGWPPPEE